MNKYIFDGVVGTLNAFTLKKDDKRLFKAVLMYLNLADNEMEFGEAIYNGPYDIANVVLSDEGRKDAWFEYGLKFNVAVAGLVRNAWKSDLNDLDTKTVIYMALLDYMGSWTAGG
jgi:hypothetical protein